ncbi:hypothetical protein ASF60_18995 [Methylobacterium sp. Leaf113]|nr:hypothetical protein ASF60_18995 [Methylobacterium sp. Leaf113]
MSRWRHELVQPHGIRILEGGLDQILGCLQLSLDQNLPPPAPNSIGLPDQVSDVLDPERLDNVSRVDLMNDAAKEGLVLIWIFAW